MALMDSESDTELEPVRPSKGILSSGSSSSSESTARAILKRCAYPWETKAWRFDSSWRAPEPDASPAVSPEEAARPTGFRADAGLHERISREEHRFQMAEAQWRHEKERLDDEMHAMQRVIGQLEETIAEKNAELASRPTHRQVKLLRNEIDRMRDPRRDKASKQQPTRELVQRDKTVHNINCERQKRKFPPLDEVPRKDLHTFAAEVLSLVDVFDLRDAERAIAKLCDVVQKTLPKMKSFAEDIFTATQAHDAKDAITLVREWADDNRNYQGWLRFHIEVRDIFADAQRGLDTPKEVLNEIRDLKEFQAKVAMGKEAYAFCSKEMKENPKELCYNLIRHFMQLFDVREMEGVLPRMNTVFGKLNELRNFWKSLCVELRLDTTTSPVLVLQRLGDHLALARTMNHTDSQVPRRMRDGYDA